MKRNTGLLVASSAALALALAAPSTAQAQQTIGNGRNFGLGLALGYPDVGISAQYFLNPRASLQFTATFWYGDGYVRGRNYAGYVPVTSGIFLRADYLFHPNVLTRGRVAALEWYIGPGANFGFGNNEWFTLGLEAPIGLAVQFQSVPIDIALEFVPRLNILNSNGVGLYFGAAGTLHVRYYF